jgi:hypothetical protein
MIEETKVGLLFIEPQLAASEMPLIDSITKKMVAAFRKRSTETGLLYKGKFIKDLCTMGCHTCSCRKASSDSCDFILPNGVVINSLAIHYIAHHRQEVPLDAIELISSFDFGEEEPDNIELNPY